MMRIAILASGRGSNAQALIDAERAGVLHASIACVISDVPQAPVLARARAAGRPAACIDAAMLGRDAFERALVARLDEHAVDLVVLAGYMRICGPIFLGSYEGRTINVHPSLLPRFPGRNAIAAAHAAGVGYTGVTVHLIDEGIDSGPIIAQVEVPVLAADSIESLAARVHAAEHRLLPAVVRDIAHGTISLPTVHQLEETPA